MAISFGPIEIGIAVGGYLLKGWWDRQNVMRDKREALYARHLDVIFTWHDVAHGFSYRNEDIDGVMKQYDEIFPELLVYARFEVLGATNEFTKIARQVARDEPETEEKKATLDSLSRAYGNLVDAIRTEVEQTSVDNLKSNCIQFFRKYYPKKSEIGQNQ